MSSGGVVLLTGPSSAGKSTIAHALRMSLPRPTVVLAADDLDLPEEATSRQWLRTLDIGAVMEMQRQFYVAYYAALAALARGGLIVVGELCFKNESHFEQYVAGTTGLDRRVLVHVTCAPDVREERERQRGDRRLGASAQTGASEWVPPAPDLRVDTTRGPDEHETVARIAQLLRLE